MPNRMVENDVIGSSRREAVQPSLWDRLVDELPGLAAETEGLRNAVLSKLEDASAIDQIISGGAREIERCTDLDEDLRLTLHQLHKKTQKMRQLESSGIVVSADVLREAVRRDIEMLFNIERLEAEFLLTERESLRIETPEKTLTRFPEVRRSVLNFGVPAFAGRMSGTDFDKDAISREIREVLRVFEPRLRKDSIRVSVSVGDKTGMRVTIDAMLMLSPVPERLRLSTTVDLDNGQASTLLEDS